MKYPVYNPSFRGNEKKYVVDCLDSTWISSKGKYINQFEEQFAQYVGVAHATAVNNGTVALHLALLALGIEAGDEIIVPTFTYVATANSILYMNAVPVFVDSLAHNWQVDPEDIKRKITPKTKAVMIVHLYGHPCDMEAIKKICDDHKLILIEDCAEAIGSRYNGKHVGTFGDISTFSFYGNKTITTGEGGMVVSPHKELIEKAVYLKNQGVSKIQYWHDMVGYNYRMTNICAAIGLAQLEQIDAVLKDKIRIADGYRNAFKNTSIEFHTQDANVFHSYWMCSILLKDAETYKALSAYLLEQGIDTRPLFHPIHTMPMYTSYIKGSYPVADNISCRGLNLPSYPELTDDDVQFISSKVVEFVG